MALRPATLVLVLVLRAMACPAAPPADALATLRRDAESRLLPIEHALDARFGRLGAVARDYAHWNDAYDFATGARAVYPGAGLLALALSSLDIHYMLVLDSTFQSRLSLEIGAVPVQQSMVPADPGLVRIVRLMVESDGLTQREQLFAGVMSINGIQSLVVARPVLRDHKEGPPGGWLALAQPFDARSLDELLASAPAGTAVPLHQLQLADIPEAEREWLDTPRRRARFHHVFGERALTTWFAVRDVAGATVWAVRLQTPVPDAMWPAVAAAARRAAAPDAGFVLLTSFAGLAALALALGWFWSRRNPPAVPAASAPRVAKQVDPPSDMRQSAVPAASDVLLGAPDGVIVAMTDGRILSANPAALALFGASEPELRRRNVLQLLMPADMSPAALSWRLQEPARQLRCALLDADGRRREIELSVSPLAGAPGTAALFLHEIHPEPATAQPGIAPDRVVVCYQPIVDVESGSVWGIEALPRWKDRPLGWILPEDAIGIATEAGEMVSIGQFVLQVVARDIERWRAQDSRLVPVSIRLAASAQEARDTRISLQRLFGHPEAVPSPVRLELSAASLRHADGLMQAGGLDGWLALGPGIVISHVGARNGAQAEQVPARAAAVKLDAGLVRSAATDPAAAAAASAIAQHAGRCNMPVICAGVDRWQQVQVLGGMGCHLAQGPLFAWPVAAADVPELLREQRFATALQDDLSETDEFPVLTLPDGERSHD